MDIQFRTCMLCQKTVRGRTDKKYCSEYCRNSYHNNLRAAGTNLMRNINHALARNRRILQELFGESPGILKTSKEQLMVNGFQWRYFTHMEQNRRGLNYFFCYDFGYREVKEDHLVIVRAKPSKSRSMQIEEPPADIHYNKQA